MRLMRGDLGRSLRKSGLLAQGGQGSLGLMLSGAACQGGGSDVGGSLCDGVLRGGDVCQERGFQQTL